MPASRHAGLDVCGHELRLSNPDKLFFPERGLTKLDLAAQPRPTGARVRS